jgi:hypothetical protein
MSGSLKVLNEIYNQLTTSVPINSYCVEKYNKNLFCFLGSSGNIDFNSKSPCVVISNTPDLKYSYERNAPYKINLTLYIHDENIIEEINGTKYIGYMNLEELSEIIALELFKNKTLKAKKLIEYSSYIGENFPLWFSNFRINYEILIERDLR